MSKRSLLIVGLVTVLVGAGGFGFWYMRQKSANQPTSPSSGDPVTSASGATNQQVSGAGLAQPASATSPQSSSKAAVVKSSADSIPQRLLLSGDQPPQEPMIVYKGQTMTEEEFKKAWATSSTNKGNVTETSPVKPIPSSDKDKDGLAYDQELTLGTDPNNADTDGDGLSDGEEVNKTKTSPKNFDTDGDGLTDEEEVKTYKTDPLKKDSDGDTYSDGVEVKGGYNPLGSGKLKQ